MKRAAFCIAASIAAFILAGVSPARAQEGEGPDGGFSAYAVARVKVLDGSVWVRPSDGGDWEEYLSNSPVPPRSRVSVPEGSEAELQFHGGQFVLLTSGTDLEVRDLQEGKSAFRLRAGEIRFDLPPDDFAPVSVRVPGGAVAQFPVPGRQWLTVTERDETRLVVRRGRAVVILDGDEHLLRAGDEALIGLDVTVGRYLGGADEYVEPPTPSMGEAPGAAPPVVVNELQEYGEWVNVPAYGYAWRPRVAVGWSPYVYGRWVWISPYGWTWVSYEPWGWYPYRCGYWVTDPVYGWIWSPYNAFVSVNFVVGSTRYAHHRVYYRPATVRFVPAGGNIRWAPLRPGERYRPAGYARGDARLAGWNRPLDSGRVFVRGGPDRREWRDYSAVRVERQAEIRKTRAAQPRPDTRTVRPENRAVRPPAAVERKKSAESPKQEKAGQQPRNRPAPKEDPGAGATRRAAPAPGKVERQAPPPRSVPAGRPPDREIIRELEPKAAPVPGRVDRQAPPLRSVPMAPPPEREIIRELAPRAVPVPGKVERQAPPPGSVPENRPQQRERVREVVPMEDRSGGPPAGRSADPGSRGQEIRVYPGGDDGGRGDYRGDARGSGQGGGSQGGGGRGGGGRGR
ncbi:MAG: FecR domain-containing protein [Deltaproteobacteria bacterium]|nr:FecR domain-containing protein [Candidatus Deferrimicrobium borealis]